MMADSAASPNSEKHVQPQSDVILRNSDSIGQSVQDSVNPGPQSELQDQASSPSKEGPEQHPADISIESGLSAQAAPNPAALNPPRKSNSEEFISVPISKLQQLTELFAQVLRESRELNSSQPDLEKGLSPEEPLIAATEIESNPHGSDSGDLFGIKDKLRKSGEAGFELDSASNQEIEEIWSEVQPWNLVRVPPSTAEDFLSQENIQRWQNLKDLPLDGPVLNAFEGKMDGDRVWKEIYTKLLKSRNTKGKYYDDLPQVMAVCLLVASNQQDHATFGYVLDCCYRSSALQQPDDSDPPSYFGHILEVLFCFLVMNDIFDFERLMIGLRLAFGHGYQYVGGSFDSDRVAWHLTTRTSLEEVLGMQISNFFKLLHIFSLNTSEVKSVPKDSAEGHTFRIDDLNIRTLESLGKLTIRWSCAFEDHLKLDLRWRTLDIFYNTLAPEKSRIAQWQNQ
jgi:hypothetical protein